MAAALTGDAGGLTRRGLLKGGGALWVGFSTAALGGLPGLAQAITTGPFPGANPGAVPNAKAVDTWLVIHENNTATLFTGRVDVGQGGPVALLQIAAEELDLAMHQITSAPAETGRSPDSGETDASSSVEVAGGMVRQAAAEARRALLAMAAAQWGVDVASLSVSNGVVSSGAASAAGKTLGYGQLIGGRQFNLPFTGNAPLKPAAAYTLVGARVARPTTREKVTGQFNYIQGMRVDGMLHGRVVRPRGQGPFGQLARVKSIDASSIAGIPGARVLRRGEFVGVVATKEWDAIKAAAQLAVVWESPTGLPGHDKLHAAMKAAKTADSVILDTGDVEAAFRAAAGGASGQRSASGSYKGPFQAHAPFAPNCAIADVKADSARVWGTTLGIYSTRMEVAKVIGLPPEKVVVQHVEGSGNYGTSTFHDVAQAAAILSQLAGRPVRLQFMRWDELGWDNFGPGHLGEVKIACDAAGKLTAYQYDGWQQGWVGIEASEEMALGTPTPNPDIGPARVTNKFNAGAMYAIPNRRLLNHHVWAKDGFLRGNPLRSPVDLAISFASEQTIDALAAQLGMDAVQFRRQNISDERWLGVLDAVVSASAWQARASGQTRRGGAALLKGRGVALGTHFVSYGAAVAEVEVDPASGVVRVTQLYGALDAGLVINPLLVENQIIGMLTQATSRMLKEEVTFDQTHVTSLDWNSYPVLRFDEHPRITPIVLQRKDKPSSGAGEEAMGAAGAAIANAFFDATGVRMTQFPLTPQRVKAALA